MSIRICRDVVDGVPVYWTPEAPRRTGALQFRVGRSDEHLQNAGITHLVEHLALFPIGRRPYGFNGMVDHIQTVFHATGSEAEVTRHLAEVCKHLTALPVDRLTAEANVLRSEATANQVVSLADRHLLLRYGFKGFGMNSAPEYGLYVLSGAEVQDWANTRFTRGNAVAWYSGPLPADLQFSLPEGPRRPTVERVELPGLPDLAWIRSSAPGVSYGLILPRTWTDVTALKLLARRLEQRLRFEKGDSYEVSFSYTPLDRSAALGLLYATCQEARSGNVRSEMLTVVDRFAAEGPTQEEIDAETAMFERWLADGESITWELSRHATDELFGNRAVSAQQLVDELRAMSPQLVRDAFARASTRACLMDNVGRAPSSFRWTGFPTALPAILPGREINTADHRFWQARQQYLVLGVEGVSLVGDESQGQLVSIRYDQCGALVVDGPQLVLLAEDGAYIQLRADQWRDGEEVLREIEAGVPASRVIRVQS